MRIKLLLPLLFCLAAPAAFGQLAYGLPPNGVGKVCSSNYAYLFNGIIYTCQGIDWTKSNSTGTWAAIGNGGGSGITSITLQPPAGFTASPSPFTANGTLMITPTPGQLSGRVIGTCGAATLFGPCQLGLTDLPNTVLNSNATYSDPPWLSLTWGGGRITGIPTFFQVANNLSEGNPATMRTSLNLGTAATMNASAFEVPLTFTSPLVRTTNTITINMWGTGSRPVAANAVGVSGNCMQWSAVGAADAGAPCGSGGGGAGLAAQLGDFLMAYTDGQHLTIGNNCSTTLPCNVRYGTQVFSITASSTITLTSGSGTIYVYMTSAGVLTMGYTTGAPVVTCSGSCTPATGITGFPNGVIPIGTWVATSGSFATLIASEFRAVYSRDPVLCNGGLVTTPSAGVTTCSVDTTIIPQKFFVTAAPGSIAGNLPGDLALDTTNHNEYVCNAPSGTAAPACTSVSTAGWLLINGGGSGGNPTISVANASSTGTTVNTLTKLTGAPSTAVIAATTDTSGVVGITTGLAGTTGSATITTSGTVTCVFDGATTANHYVQISSTTGGDCHDSGAATYPGSGQVLGRVLSTNGSAGSYGIDLFPSELQPASSTGCTAAGASGVYQESNGAGGCTPGAAFQNGIGFNPGGLLDMGGSASGNRPMVQQYTVGTAGVTIGQLVSSAGTNPPTYIATPTGINDCGEGFSLTTMGATGQFNLAAAAGMTVSGIADGTITAGHLLGSPVTTAGRVSDLGVTDTAANRAALTSITCIVGTAITGNTVGLGVQVKWDGVGSHGGATGVISFGTNNGLTGGPITVTGTVGLATIPNNAGLCNNSGGVAAPTTGNCTVTGTAALVMANAPTLVAPLLGAATATSLLASGIVDGAAPVTITTGASATLGGAYKSGYTINQEATAATAVTYTLPTAAAGLQYCVVNGYNGSAPDTGALELLTSASGQFIEFTDGTLSATGGYVISGGAARDSACVVGVDSTHWLLYPSSGTWAKH